MPVGFNRVRQVRVAERLRSNMLRDEALGLPVVETLTISDQRDLCEASGDRLAAVAIHLVGEPGSVREAASEVAGRLRRTDILCCSRSTPQLLVVLAPGVDPKAGWPMADRLFNLLANRPGGASRVGAAYRSAPSVASWTVADLVAEAIEAASSQPLAA